MSRIEVKDNKRGEKGTLGKVPKAEGNKIILWAIIMIILFLLVRLYVNRGG